LRRQPTFAERRLSDQFDNVSFRLAVALDKAVDRGWAGPLSLAAAPYCSEAEEADTEQRDRCRLGYEFGDYHLAVAGLEIGNQDLVSAR
jgi:hypothetical protein